MRLGLITPPVAGHLHPFGALGRALQKRGHHVSIFHIEDLGDAVAREELSFVPIGQRTMPPGTLSKQLSGIGARSGIAALRFAVQTIVQTTHMLCSDLPSALAQQGIEALLVDQTEPAGAAVADHLKIPYVTICNALMLNREPRIPPPFVGWTFHEGGWAQLRNRMGYWFWDRMTGSVLDVVNGYRTQWGLARYPNAEASFSDRAQISQEFREFEYPGQQLPSTFYFVGPLRDAHLDATPFPWEKLDGRPLVYASLGTQQGGKLSLLGQIAEACKGLAVQLVVSHARCLSDSEVATLSGSAVVVPYAPQRLLLQRAALAITHAGLNTVLDALSAGVPLVAIPITYEQPAIAARICRLGAGMVLPLKGLKTVKLRNTIKEVLNGIHYRQAAQRIRRSLQTTGVERAVQLIEEVLIERDMFR